MRATLHRALRPLAAAAVLGCLAATAQARVSWGINLNLGYPGYYGGGYAPVYGAGYGAGYGGYVNALPVGAVSVQVGGGRYWHHGGYWYRPWGPRWVVVAPPVVVPLVQTVEAAPPPVAVAPLRPDPVIYPRNGQSAEQTEADRQECNRWATTQPAALADSAVFIRAVEACMDGRGYTVK